MATETREWGTLPYRIKWVRDNRIRDAGSYREMSARLSEITDEIGVDGWKKDAVGSYEKEGANVPADYVRAVAVLGNVDAGWLLTGEGSPDTTRALPADAPMRDRVEHATRVLEAALAEWSPTESPGGRPDPDDEETEGLADAAEEGVDEAHSQESAPKTTPKRKRG